MVRVGVGRLQMVGQGVFFKTFGDKKLVCQWGFCGFFERVSWRVFVFNVVFIGFCLVFAEVFSFCLGVGCEEGRVQGWQWKLLEVQRALEVLGGSVGWREWSREVGFRRWGFCWGRGQYSLEYFLGVIVLDFVLRVKRRGYWAEWIV